MARRFLVEFDSHTGSTQEKVRLSTGQGYQTKLSETPSRAKYLPLVVDAGNVNSFLFGDGSTSGFSEVGLGKVRLNNADGTLTYLEERGLGGFDLDVREEKGENYPADFPVRIAAAISYAEFTSYYTDLIIKDKTSVFRDDQYQEYKYLGTNNGSSIELEGTENDIGGLPKPHALGGLIGNITPVMVNEAKEIWQVSSEPVAEIVTTYIGRETSTVIDTVHTSLTSFLADTVTAGQINVYYGDPLAAAGDNERGCYIMFGTTPSHAVTLDVIEGWKNLVTYSEDLSDASWTKTHVSGVLPVASEARITEAGDARVTEAGDARVTEGDEAFLSITGLVVTNLVENSTNNIHGLEQTITSTLTKPQALSAIVAPASGDRLITLVMRNGSSTGNGVSVTFDLSDGTIDTAATNNGNATGAAATIEDLGNGFYKVELTCTRVDSSGTNLALRILLGNGSAYLGNGTSGIYITAIHASQWIETGPYVKTAGAAVYNNHIPALLWKILDRKGYTLDTLSILIAQAQFAYHAQHWQDTDEILTGEIIDEIKDSAMFYLTNDITGKYIVKRLELPTEDESVKTYVGSQLLGGKGNPKIKQIASRDQERGIPIYQTNIGYGENYTVMSKEQLTGAADTLEELAYVGKRFRVANDNDNTVKTQYPNSQERTRNTKLVLKAAADVQAAYELTIFKLRRPVIEVKIPIEFATKTDGTIIEKGEVITVNSKHYRILGQKIRLPSSNRNELNAGAITFQGWGGVS